MILINFAIFSFIFIYFAMGEEETYQGPVSDDEAAEYMSKFGYLSPSKMLDRCENGEKCEEADTENVLVKAVKKFQRFAGLPVTGELDIKTKKKMAVPRCGIQDVEELNMPGAEKPIWKKSVVTYKFQNFSPQLPQAKIKEAVKRAYDTWATVMPVKFQETTSGNADITIMFGARGHGDSWPFDGKGKVLAHATAPTDGKLHFDEEERWTIGPENPRKLINQEYTDFFPVVLHEGGHTLGLKHSDDPEAIMAPFAQEWVDSGGRYITPKLKPKDIQMIQELYGRGGGASSSSSSSASKQRPGTGTTRPAGGSFGGRISTTTTRRPRPGAKSPSGGMQALMANLWDRWLGDKN